MDNPKVFWVHPWELAAHPGVQGDERNSTYGDLPNRFAESFATSPRGWDPGQGLVNVWIPRKGLLDSDDRCGRYDQQLQKAAEVRVAQLQEYQEASSDDRFVLESGASKESTIMASLNDLVPMHLSLFFEDEDPQKVRIPKYMINCAFSRMLAITACEYAYSRRNNGKTFKIPIMIHEYTNDKELDEARWFENQQQGRVKYDLNGMLHIAKRACRYGDSATEVKRKLNIEHGYAQKLHACAKCDGRFPEVNFINRLIMPPPKDDKGNKIAKPGYRGKDGPLSFSKQRAAGLRTCLGTIRDQKSADETAKEAMGGVANVGEGKQATFQEFEKYQELLHDAGKNESKVMDKNTFKEFRSSVPSEDLKNLYDGILTDDGVAVGKFNEHYNSLTADYRALLKENEELKAKVAELQKKLKSKKKA